ncbi:DUF4138 domain-containing protein [Hymenobacter sp. BT188]|uniref:DUF4138 domain-containing protein n=1 Tax=Hymenobacter sp. BT188 TaxID=2763504 RepID=UPI0016516537|nr:DUF4138 domain-containing protein [Hymenobacter sp. BT188]MBC6609065.1 DUF4138 domain-containing protein [Hymenobacter sp. BT188]
MRITSLTALFGLVLPFLITSPVAAQRATSPAAAVVATDNLLDVAVSDSSTTYLVFGGPISLVDVGMANNYLVKIEANAVFVRARRKHAPPTPMLIRYGSKYWMGRLVYVNRPVLQLYDFQKDGTLSVNGKSSSNGAAPENELALDKEREKKAIVEGKLSKLRKAREEHQAVAVVDNDLVLSLANVRNDKDFTYLRFKVINKTNIDYNVDFTDFQLVENAQQRFLARKKNEARRPLAPSGGQPNQTITGRTTGYLTYAIPLYAATERGYLEVTLRELNGARVLVLPVPSRVINRAATI